VRLDGTHETHDDAVTATADAPDGTSGTAQTVVREP
jgi:hypothetical protein